MSYSLDFNDLTTENPMFGYLMGKIFGTRNQRYLKSLRPLLRKINALEPEMQALADEELAAKLGIRVGDPILRRKRLVLDATGFPVEFNVGYYRADSFTYRIEAEK